MHKRGEGSGGVIGCKGNTQWHIRLAKICMAPAVRGAIRRHAARVVLAGGDGGESFIDSTAVSDEENATNDTGTTTAVVAPSAINATRVYEVVAMRRLRRRLRCFRRL